MKKIIFTLSILLFLSSLAAELNLIDGVDKNAENEISKSGKFQINFGKTKHRRGDVLDRNDMDTKTNPDLDIDVKQMINQSVLDYTTQPITPFF